MDGNVPRAHRVEMNSTVCSLLSDRDRDKEKTGERVKQANKRLQDTKMKLERCMYVMMYVA